MAPTLIASYSLVTSAVDSSTLTTPSFTPANGEVIVVKAATWDSTQTMSTPTGGSQTYTPRVAATSGGFRPWVGIWTAVVSGSPGSMTISSTPSANSWHNMVVERWSNASLAATPVSNSAQNGTGAASSTLTTSASGSVISWVAADAQSLNPSTKAYLNSATEELCDDQHAPSNGVWYYAYQSVAAAGSTAYGLSAPTGMQWWIAGVEILDSGSGPVSKSLADAGAGADSLTVSAGSSLADGGSATQALTVAVASPLADGGTATQTLDVAAGALLADTGSSAQALTVAAATGMTDGGSATESLTVSVILALPDVGAATDGVSNGLGTNKALVDGGFAADTLSVVAAIQLADTGSSTQAFGATASVQLADVAAGAEALTTPVRTIQLADSGVASDALGVAAAISLVDVGSGADGAIGSNGTSVSKSLADGGSARDWLHAKAIRPSTGTTARPNTGTTPRPDTGTTFRP